MSGKDNCRDNACAETFFRSLKREWFYEEYLLSEKKIKMLIFEYIEIFYNRSGLRYTLNFKTPVDYEKHFEVQHGVYLKKYGSVLKIRDTIFTIKSKTEFIETNRIIK